eukprot:g57751.t1
MNCRCAILSPDLHSELEVVWIAMYITQIVVDGFKSYATRTIIAGWDPQFNAITGLNGSGKSNILDAICFVLGISNLSQVRARNLQDLIYKQGQSRVTKASVTIYFDNRNTKASPVGYEQYQQITVNRQVVIGGRNKYLINGHTAQLSKVQNLFHSVQLNVNNPHFLIMQGRITKVINMKPPEILGMLEEASGTRMYETKKVAAEKTIAKKQAKVDEIETVLREEITPTLEKLRSERAGYMKWTSNESEIERLERFSVAAAYHEAFLKTQGGNEKRQELQDSKQEKEDLVEATQTQVKQVEDEISSLQEQRQTELEKRFKSKEKLVTERSKELVKHTSHWQNQKDNLTADEKQLKQAEDALKELAAAIEAKKQERADKKDSLAELEKQHAELAAGVASMEGQLLGMDMSGDGEKEQGTLASQLMAAQRTATEAKSAAQQGEVRKKHLSSELKTKQKQVKAAAKEHEKALKALSSNEEQIAQLEKELAKLPEANPAQERRLSDKIAQLEHQVSELRDERDRAAARLTILSFNYADPTPAFDRRKVKGLVARLVTVKESKAATALEVAAGGRLYHVVVDSEQTGKQLLDKGKLQRRVTIIPLNKISSKPLQPAVVQQAEALVGKDNAQVALSLVGYESDVAAAMKYVFGNTFVCSDNKSAEAVTFHEQIKTRSVTLQGDIFDPAGTLTGGAGPKGGGVLAQLQELNALSERVGAREAELQATQAELEALHGHQEASKKLAVQKELLCTEVALAKSRMQDSTYAKLKQESDDMEAQLTQIEADAKQAASAEAAALKKAGELERSIKDFEKERKNKLKQMEKQVVLEKKKLAETKKTLKNEHTQLEKLALEEEGLKADLEAAKEQVVEVSERIKTLAQKVQELEQMVSEQKEDYDKVNKELEEEKSLLAATDKKLSALQKQKDKLEKQQTDAELEIKSLGMQITRMVSDQTEANKVLAKLEKEHKWIEGEKHLFGRDHSDYDFQKQSRKQASQSLAKLRTEQDTLSKKINKKVMGMFEKAENEYGDLMKKKEIILQDKSKIEQVIKELDQKKSEALEKTWKKVTTDFGSIFSSLLPGTKAKLVPVEGKSVLEGLELKVAFGGVWKESLSELSGGQRSLLALSLILAMLLFKPAP